MKAPTFLKRLTRVFLISAVAIPLSLPAENEPERRFADAVKNGNLEVVRELLKVGFDPNTRVPDSGLDYTPLFLAVQSNQTAVTETLLNAGADTAMEDGNGDPVMVHAAQKAYIDQARLLIRHGVSIDSRNRQGITALMRGARYEDAADIQTKLDLGADVELTDAKGLTALMMASAAGNIAAMEVLLKAGAKPNVIDKHGKSALMLALSTDSSLDEKKTPGVVKLLIEHGADPNLADPEGVNALILALDSYRCPPEAIVAILNAKPDVKHRDKEGSDALFHAMSHDGTRGLMPRLLELGADLKTTNNDGVDLLMLAAAGNDPVQVRFLLDHGLSPIRTTKSGEMAVHFALRVGRWIAPSSDSKTTEKRTVEILQLLHERGANLTIPDADGDTALHLSATSGEIAVFTYLLPFFEHLDLKNHKGETPLHLAATSAAGIVDLLLPKYPDPDVKDSEGRTAFINASADGYEAAQESLLKAGANIDATDKSGNSALDEAVSDNDPEKIRFLIGHSADPEKLRESNLQLLRVSRLFQDKPETMKDYTSLVELLVGFANDIDARDAANMTSLMWVAASNNTTALEAVLKHQPDLNLRSPDGRTAMMWAACSRAEPAMEILRKAGADTSLRDSTNRTANDWLTWTKGPVTGTPTLPGDDKLLLEWLSAGRKSALLACLDRHEPWSKDDRVADMPPLHLAATLGEVGAMKDLLDRGAPPDQLSEDQSTPLMAAAANGESETVRILLARRADPALRDNHGKRAIDLAVELKHPATARIFLTCEKPFSPDESALLATLVWIGDEPLLQDFLKSGASIPPVVKQPDDCDPFLNDRNRPRPEAPLVAAAVQPDSKMLKILAEFPEASGTDNPSLLAIALHAAAENGRLDNVKFLIENLHSDFDNMADSFGGVIRIGSSDQEATKPVEGFTALSQALEENHLDVVRYLIDKGAVITGRTRSGDPPLTFAVRHHQYDLLEYFLKHKAPTGLFDLNGDTALHVAATADDETATRLLLTHGADPKLKSSNGMTPLDKAKKFEATKTTALLESQVK